MCRARWIVIGFLMMTGAPGMAAAKEGALKDLPKDVLDLALVWTEPFKQAAKNTRSFDPISGAWFGLLEGSVKSLERTAGLFLSPEDAASERQQRDPKLLRYSF